MFKRISVLAMMFAGGMAMLTPAVAQARDCGYGYRRYEHRECRDHYRWDRCRRDYWHRY
jgi:hypothetical protein